jgi:hypothetical protein
MVFIKTTIEQGFNVRQNPRAECGCKPGAIINVGTASAFGRDRPFNSSAAARGGAITISRASRGSGLLDLLTDGRIRR